jgi:metallophosphoesterase superfamily enzyme
VGVIEVFPGCFAHGSGALWIPESRTAIIADLHLGYGWAQRRRGELGPMVDGGVERLLDGLRQALEPRAMVLLGDIVHAPRPLPEEREHIARVLTGLQNEVSLYCVLGNHDRAFERDFAGLELHIGRDWNGSGIHAVHGDVLPAEVERVVAGHFHPALSIEDDAGFARRMRVFLVSRNLCVLPAFSPFAAGCDIRRHGLPGALREKFRVRPPRILVAAGDRVIPLGNPAREVSPVTDRP